MRWHRLPILLGWSGVCLQATLCQRCYHAASIKRSSWQNALTIQPDRFGKERDARQSGSRWCRRNCQAWG